MILRLLLFGALAAAPLPALAQPRVPTIDDLLSIEAASDPQISPDGRFVAYVVTGANFDEDEFVSQIWLAEVESGATRQLTRGAKSASSPRWAPDGEWLAFTSAREGDRSQVYAIRPGGGEAVRLTAAKTSVGAYVWAPDGSRIAFLAPEPESEAARARAARTGAWFVVRREYEPAQIWTLDVGLALGVPQPGDQVTHGTRHVGDLAWSPDGTRLAFSATVDPDLINRHTSDIYVTTLATGQTVPIVELADADTAPHWSPDGAHVVFSTFMGRSPSVALNRQLAVVPAGGGAPRSLTAGVDEHATFVGWTTDGLYFAASERTASHLYVLDPESLAVRRVTGPDAAMTSAHTLSADGRHVAFIDWSPTTLGEVAVSPVDAYAPRALTTMTAQTERLTLGTRELVSWKSRDGAEIEGVLIKPARFDPTVRHPLLCVIHGGPTGIDRPGLLMAGRRTYPVDLWAARGAVVLQVNYRGSAGYGEAFRRLNLRNLGVGDAWDVLSGVDHLIAQGFVDADRMGCMGWSQGGYISAFLTATTDRFAAISVGAGISNWATYYYNTDITQFTLGYLGDDPVDDPEIYRKTSPMSYVGGASTPTLIQHGELDRRVPIANAYELRLGLADRGVPVEMVVYKAFGHGITRPRAQRAVMWHNLAWFDHHLWGEPLPDLTAPPGETGREPSTLP